VEPLRTKSIYCNHCRTDTRHVFVASRDYGGEGSAEWGEYILWACAGCDTCTMEDCYSSDDMIDHFEDEDAYESIYYPRRNVSIRPTKHFARLPRKLWNLYDEVVASHNHDLGLLCAAGLRSLIEGICADKGIEGNNLNARIDGMKSLLPEKIARSLHFFRSAGNKAVHNLEALPQAELAQGIDVIEDILNFLYELEHKAERLGKAHRFGW
jgi:hypothetical protein